MMDHIEIDDCTLIMTCYACPEQYNVFLDGKQIGYLRLRHGRFRADYPVCGGRSVYEAEPTGYGRFDDDERLWHLRESVAVLKAEHAKQGATDDLLDALRRIEMMDAYHPDAHAMQAVAIAAIAKAIGNGQG